MNDASEILTGATHAVTEQFLISEEEIRIAIEQGFLEREYRKHLLLDRAFGDQAVRRHDPRLPDAVRAIRRLILDGWIPPRVKVNHRVGRGEVQTRPARSQRDEEKRRSALLEASNSAA